MHRLEKPWTFWISKRTPFTNRDSSSKDTYFSTLKEIGTFSTIEEFWAYVFIIFYLYYLLLNFIIKIFYSFIRYQFHIVTVDKFPKDTELHCFRKGIKPAWEDLPEGGSWNLRFRESSFRVKLWEDLLLSTIGENFEEPEVVGICLSVRPKDDCLSVWFRSATTPIKNSVEFAFSILFFYIYLF